MRHLLAAAVLASLTCSLHATPVRGVQEALRARNLYFGDIDGQYTGATSEAVRLYQARKGFDPTGSLDAPTLTSLGLEPVSEPDEPILRSDLGLTRSEREARRQRESLATSERKTSRRRSTTEPDLEPVAEYVENAPPKMRRLPSPKQKPLREFVSSYLAATESNDTRREMKYYADEVDYFDRGKVKRETVRKNADRYKRVWPKRDYQLIKSISYGSRGEKDVLVIKFLSGFSLQGGPDREVAFGRTLNSVTVRVEGTNLKITGIHEERLGSGETGERPGFFCRVSNSIGNLFSCP